MNVLVTAASRQGATYEIAEAIGRVLRERGFDSTISRPEQVDDVTGYDAVVIGSAIYTGHWLEPANDFARRFAHELAQRPVWLFSSGPVGDPRRKLVQKMTADPLELPSVLAQTHARGHRILAGRLAGDHLAGAQRLSLLIFRGLQGDWRDWAEIERYATAIADALDNGARGEGLIATHEERARPGIRGLPAPVGPSEEGRNE
jgi:menaquinone-dependent protoporphyrinogen oxidase